MMGSHYYVAPEILTAQPSSDKGTVSLRLKLLHMCPHPPIYDGSDRRYIRVLLLLYATEAGEVLRGGTGEKWIFGR